MSFPNLFVPRSVDDNSDPKYSVNILIAKNDPALAAIVADIEKCKAEGFPNGFPATAKCCLKDCAGEGYAANLAGYMELRTSASENKRPPVVDMTCNPVMDRAQVFAGAEAWFAVGIMSYNKPLYKGVGAYINGVMITGVEGATGRLDGSQSPEQMFAGIGTGTPAAPVAPPAAPVAPPAAPVAPPAAPVAPPAAPVAPPAAPVAPPAGPQMTVLATASYADYIAAGWTDEQLRANGFMV